MRLSRERWQCTVEPKELEQVCIKSFCSRYNFLYRVCILHSKVYYYTRYVPTGSYMYLTCVCMVTVTLSQMFLECLIVTWFGLQKAILMSVI